MNENSVTSVDVGATITRASMRLYVAVPLVTECPHDMRLNEIVFDKAHNRLYLGTAKSVSGVSEYRLSDLSEVEQSAYLSLTDLKNSLVFEDRIQQFCPKLIVAPTIALGYHANMSVGCLCLDCQSIPYGYGILHVGTGEKNTQVIKVTLG